MKYLFGLIVLAAMGWLVFSYVSQNNEEFGGMFEESSQNILTGKERVKEQVELLGDKFEKVSNDVEQKYTDVSNAAQGLSDSVGDFQASAENVKTSSEQFLEELQ